MLIFSPVDNIFRSTLLLRLRNHIYYPNLTCLQGVIAYKSLPRPMFGALQHRTFPIYFVISTLLSAGMLGLWTWLHPAVQVPAHILRPDIADVAQAYALAVVFLSQSTNYFVIGPLTSK